MNCAFAKTIYTGKKILENAYVIFRDDQIVSLSSSQKGTLIDRYAVITPAFIDAHSHIGMERAGEPYKEAEVNEHLDSILSHADALDSVQMDDASFKDAVEMGVLYSCVVPGSGNIIGGQSAVIRNYAGNTSEALIGRAGLKAAFGYNPMSTVDWKGTRPSTRMGALAVLRAKLEEVHQKMIKYKQARGNKKQDITFSADEAVLRDLLSKKIRLRAHVHKTDDIAALLRLVDHYNIRITVEHAMDVHQSEIFKQLKKRQIPVVFGPMDSLAYKVELKHENWRNVLHLLDSKVEFGLMSDHPVILARQLFLQTRWFLRCGMHKQDAIELVSRKNARILGIDKKVGTLEKGKWASFVGWNGDPFDLSSYPAAVFGEGKLLFKEE